MPAIKLKKGNKKNISWNERSSVVCLNNELIIFPKVDPKQSANRCERSFHV